jgi:hypothetical protein
MWEKVKELLGLTLPPPPPPAEPTHELPQTPFVATVYRYDPKRIQDDQRIASDLTLRSRYMIPLVLMLLEDPHLTNKRCRELLGKKVRTAYMREARKVVAHASLEEQMRLASSAPAPSLQLSILAREMRRLGVRSISLTPSGFEAQSLP